MKTNYFQQVVTKGVVCAIIGIIAGMVLGALIFALQGGINWAIESIYPAAKGDYSGSFFPSALSWYTGMGMCFGAIIGGIMGSVIAIKEKK